MSETMSPEAEVRAQRARVQCLKPQPCADRYCTKHGREGATIDGLLALVSAEREARQRAERERDAERALAEERLKDVRAYRAACTVDGPDGHPRILRPEDILGAHSELREAAGRMCAARLEGGPLRMEGAPAVSVWADSFLALRSLLASTPASLAASYRARVERETIERCANECEAKAADMRGLMHGLWLSSGADECAARLRSLADAEKGGEQT
jgi:hypothetical protein